jgi:rhamnosyltransferase
MVHDVTASSRRQGPGESIPAPSSANTCAIVVTYNPDAEFRERIVHVSSQFPQVFIVDNGSNEIARAMLRLVAQDPKIKLIANSANLGIAEALNQGMKLGLESGFDWAVTLDQDTVVFHDLLQTLLEVHATCGHEKVLIGGNYLNINKNRHFVDYADGDTGFLERKTLITAGTLVPLQASIHMGGFRDDYFIDSVDHEFCLRARAGGFKILISRRPVMSQHIGAKMEAASWWSKFASFNHSAIRKYYIARNTLVTARDYLFREPAWSLRQAWRLLSDFASIILFESNKYRKSSAFVSGLWDGARNKMGPLSDNRIKFWK